MVKTVQVLDTTLRDGEQTPGVSLTLEKKLRIAKVLDDLGVDVIEAGSAITSEGEREAMKAIASTPNIMPRIKSRREIFFLSPIPEIPRTAEIIKKTPNI